MSVTERYVVYGRTVAERPAGVTRAVSGEFPTEEQAVGFVVLKRLELGTLDAIVARVTKTRIARVEGGRGQWEQKNEVLLRLGAGKGWWE